VREFIDYLSNVFFKEYDIPFLSLTLSVMSFPAITESLDETGPSGKSTNMSFEWELESQDLN